MLFQWCFLLGTGVPPLPPTRPIGIKTLAYNSLQSLERQGLIAKVFITNELSRLTLGKAALGQCGGSPYEVDTLAQPQLRSILARGRAISL